MTALRKILPWVSIGLCGFTVILLLVDLIWPDFMLFLREFTKIYLLVTVLVASACGVMAITLARRNQRRAKQRRRW